MQTTILGYAEISAMTLVHLKHTETIVRGLVLRFVQMAFIWKIQLINACPIVFLVMLIITAITVLMCVRMTLSLMVMTIMVYVYINAFLDNLVIIQLISV